MCLFCDIADHKKEAYIVDETKNTISFLDINPANEGHVLSSLECMWIIYVIFRMNMF